MKGWQIFTHSVRLVFTNVDHALRVSLVLYLVLAASQVASFLYPPEMTEIDGIDVPVMSGAYAMQNLIFAVLAIIASLWIAVAWHRFVLAEEYPKGWIPRWHGASMLGYLGRSILLGLVVIIGVSVASLPFGLIVAGLPGLVFLLPFVLVGLAAYLFFRLGVMLPGAALGPQDHLFRGMGRNAGRKRHDPDAGGAGGRGELPAAVADHARRQSTFTDQPDLRTCRELVRDHHRDLGPHDTLRPFHRETSHRLIACTIPEAGPQNGDERFSG